MEDADTGEAVDVDVCQLVRDDPVLELLQPNTQGKRMPVRCFVCVCS